MLGKTEQFQNVPSDLIEHIVNNLTGLSTISNPSDRQRVMADLAERLNKLPPHVLMAEDFERIMFGLLNCARMSPQLANWGTSVFPKLVQAARTLRSFQSPVNEANCATLLWFVNKLSDTKPERADPVPAKTLAYLTAYVLDSLLQQIPKSDKLNGQMLILEELTKVCAGRIDCHHFVWLADTDRIQILIDIINAWKTIPSEYYDNVLELVSTMVIKNLSSSSNDSKRTIMWLLIEFWAVGCYDRRAFKLFLDFVKYNLDTIRSLVDFLPLELMVRVYQVAVLRNSEHLRLLSVIIHNLSQWSYYNDSDPSPLANDIRDSLLDFTDRVLPEFETR